MRLSKGTIGTLAIVATCLVVAPFGVLRDLWFDEALTVLNFAVPSGFCRSYQSYVIPNNHILYTGMLHYWLQFAPGNPVAAAWWCRVLSLLFGMGSLLTLYHGFRRGFTAPVMLFVLISMEVSLPFVIYATAVRGYMAGMFFGILALLCGRRFAAGNGAFGSWLGFLICATAATGIAPSNLAMNTAVVLYLAPCFGRRFLLNRKFWTLALAVPAGFLLFYWPIRHDLLACAALGEGWSDKSAALGSVILGAVATFAVPLTAALALLPGVINKNFLLRNWPRIAILLLPLPAIYLLKVAPFPRVFFPMFWLFGLLLAGLLRREAAKFLRHNRRRTVIAKAAAMLLVIVFALGIASFRQSLARSGGDLRRDDFFGSYYATSFYCPSETVRAIAERSPQSPLIFASFKADPWPLMFYYQREILFDGPQGRVAGLPPGAWMIIHESEDPQALAARFGGRAKLLFVNPTHKVYRFEK